VRAGPNLLCRPGPPAANSLMASTRFASVHQEETPQYAYVLAVVSGGLADIIPQIRGPFESWHLYALLGAVFGFFWPAKAVRWGAWLCLPVFMMMFINMVTTGWVVISLNELSILGWSLGPGCLGAYMGSKLYALILAGRRRASVRGCAAGGVAPRRPARGKFADLSD
jgi:hypothetical protein